MSSNWPYAALAIVQHEWDTNHLNVWVIFRRPMDQTVKPANNLWLCEADAVPKAITVSAWQDAWTILLTVPDVLALPGTVTLEYDGPSVNLRTTWDKQWEPWGPILSLNIPYGWEDILVVDTVLKRVGIQPSVVAAAVFAYPLTVVSPDGDQQVGIYHDNNHARINWDKGNLQLETDEGINTDSLVQIRGKGTGRGYLRVYNNSATGYIAFTRFATVSYLFCTGGSPTSLEFQHTADVPINLFSAATEGQTEKHKIYGWKAGDTQKRHVDLQISPNANNAALWSSVRDYVFDGALSSATRTFSTGPAPQDDVNVSGINTLFIDCALNDVVIGGMLGGVNGQVLHVVRLCASINDVTLEHNEGTGNQDIFMHRGADETLTGEYGGWTLVCNGTNWYDVSHAKHV